MSKSKTPSLGDWIKATAKDTSTGKFKLGKEAAALLRKYQTQIRKGITNICELHTHDEAPSLSQSDFEKQYIEKCFGQLVAALHITIKSMTEALVKQQEAKLKKIQEDTEA